MHDVQPRRHQATSTAAYTANEIQLGTLAERVASFLRKENGNFWTRHELANQFGAATATMSGVVRRLLDEGHIEEVPGRFECGITGNSVRVVRAAGKPS